MYPTSLVLFCRNERRKRKAIRREERRKCKKVFRGIDYRDIKKLRK